MTKHWILAVIIATLGCSANSGSGSNDSSKTTSGGASQGGTKAMGGADASNGGSLTGGTTSGGSGGTSKAGSSGTSAGGAGGGDAGQGSGGHAPDPCLEAGTCTPGAWTNVTPAAIDLTNGDCGNYGTKSVQVAPGRPQDMYTLFFCQGLWKSTDYGATWSGPVNTGMNAATFGDCAGGIAIPPNSDSETPTLYAACIRGNGVGFWKSTNGGVDWNTYNVDPAPPGAAGQQFYSPAVDPYDPNHLLMAGHALELLVESTDGGATWSKVTVDPGMSPAGTAGINFIDTGSTDASHDTWLWMASQAGGVVGTWRTTNAGSSWTKVESNEHVNGSTHSEFFQGDTSGVVYMAGMYSANGDGVFRSVDFGATWSHVGLPAQEAVVMTTPKNAYAMFGWGIGSSGTVDPTLERGVAPGTGTWTKPGTPAEMTQGPAQVAVTNDGTYSIILAANYNAGLWRYIEP